ncbi:unnamed protein product [Tenebrio molitor]|nr:unnamed protein product [Tenebrio molitor]
MSQASVSRCIMPVCRVILRVLLNRWIKFPTDRQTVMRTKNLFWNKYGFPDVLGAIDCTHVAIIAPPAEHPVYPAAPFYNRKSFYSFNVQIITDASLDIINMNARYPGSVHGSVSENE